MTRTRWPWAVLLVAGLCGPVAGAEPERYPYKRYARAESTLYVVIKPGLGLDRRPSTNRPRAKYWLARGIRFARSGTIPEPEWRLLTGRRGAPVRKGDKVVAKGKLTHLPTQVLIFESGNGFVALDHAPSPGRETCVTIVNVGKKARSFTLGDLAEKHLVATMRNRQPKSGLHWMRGNALDETRRIVYVGLQSTPPQLVAIPLDDGGPRTLTSTNLVELAEKSEVADLLPLVFRVADSQGIKEVRSGASRVLSDETKPMRTRIEAARVLRSKEARQYLKKLLGKPRPGVLTTRLPIFVALPATMGKDAVPILLAWVRHNPDDAIAILAGVWQRDPLSRECATAVMGADLPEAAKLPVLLSARATGVEIKSLRPFVQSKDEVTLMMALDLARKDPKRYAADVVYMLDKDNPLWDQAALFFTTAYDPGALERLRALRGTHTPLGYDVVERAIRNQIYQR